MPKRGRAPRPGDVLYQMAENRREGVHIAARHRILALLAEKARWHDGLADNRCPPSGWAVVISTGTVHLNPERGATSGEWAWIAAHCLLHLGFGHLSQRRFPARRYPDAATSPTPTPG